MHYYIFSQSQSSQVETLSKCLYKLSEVPGTTVTSQLFSHITHPDTGEVAIQVPDSLTFYVHPQASDAVIGEAVQCISDLGGDAVVAESILTDGKGEHLNLSIFLGNLFVSTTKSNLEANGWFPDNELM